MLSLCPIRTKPPWDLHSKQTSYISSNTNCTNKRQPYMKWDDNKNFTRNSFYDKTERVNTKYRRHQHHKDCRQ